MAHRLRILVLGAAIGALVAASTVAVAPQVRPAAATIDALAWLVGTWVGVPGRATTEERWTPASGGAMLGVSRTIADARMVAFEYLRIVERDGGLVYVAQPGGRAPTEFVLTRISPSEAVFENPAHDYPKIISYSLDANGTLRARISDSDGRRPMEFVFTRAADSTAR